MGTHAEPDRRQFGRRQTCLHGVIVARGRSREPCVMRNLSDGGALLEVGQPFLLPNRFRLHIEANGLDVECEIAHRDQSYVGVRFLGVPSMLQAERPVP